MLKEVTAVFDIGKTNKKFFLFDTNFKEVYRRYIELEQIVDEDGYPTENIDALHRWMKAVFHEILNAKKYDITSINFSSYGASWVHLNERGQVIAPLYNYTKELPKDLIATFYKTYGPELAFGQTTGTTNSGMLNAGMQLYWLKHQKPHLYKKIKWSMHLPQYLSYMFTGIPVSEYTCIGCHTALWDYDKQDYHSWVYQEGIHEKLAPIVAAETSINMKYNQKRLKIGVGIHDSSSALLPYVRSIDSKFVLLSTGTWSICLNPFSNGILSKNDVADNCINYMRINGEPVKASRLFLGHLYNTKTEWLANYFNKPVDYHKKVAFDSHIIDNLTTGNSHYFTSQQIENSNSDQQIHIPFKSYEVAYHQLVLELVELQVSYIKKAIGQDVITNLYIDGGFANNLIFVELLSRALPTMKIKTTDASLGSALGAAIAISNVKLDGQFLHKNYALKKHSPLITT